MKKHGNQMQFADILAKRDDIIKDSLLADLYSDYYTSIAGFIEKLPQELDVYKSIATSCRIDTRASLGINTSTTILTEEEEHNAKDQLTTKLIEHLDLSMAIYKLELLSKDRQKAEIKSEVNHFLSKTYYERAYNEGIQRNMYLNRILIYLEFILKHLKLEIHEEESRSRQLLAYVTKKKLTKKVDNENWKLFDIWMIGIEDKLRKLNYENVVDKFLVENDFIKKTANGYEWKYFPGTAKNKIYTAFLVQCEQRGFIALDGYKAPILTKIIENTFNKKLGSVTAVQKGEIQKMRDCMSREHAYANEFRLMPTIKLASVISSF